MSKQHGLQGFIDKNAQITFSNQVLPQTSEYFKGLTKSTLRLVGNLLPDEKELVEEIFPCPVLWVAPARPEIRPHPVLVVLRDGMRQMFVQTLTEVKHLKKLYIGSTYREVRNLTTDDSAHFSLYGTEPKDDTRIFLGMQEHISKLFNDIKGKYPEFEHHDFEFAMTQKELTTLFAESEGLRDRIGWNKERSGEKFGCLVYNDSHYNKTREDFYMDFLSTGATVGYVLGMLPVELLEEKGPINGLYSFSRKGSQVRMTDARGFAHGYVHDWEAWSTLMRYPAYNGVQFNLVFEIIARVGPFCTVKITRTQNGGIVTRDLTLYKKPYVKVVNLGYYMEKPKTLAELMLKKVVDFDQYFVIAADEYYSVYDYISSLASKVFDGVDGLPAVVSFIRKRSGGAALIDKVFTKEWDLESQHYALLAAVVILRVMKDRDMLEGAKATLRSEGLFARVWRKMLSVHVPEWLVDLCYTTDILQKAVKPFDPILEQTVVLEDKRSFGPALYQISAGPKRGHVTSTGDVHKCEMCSMFPWLAESCKDDLQVMKCGKDIFSQTLTMTDEEVNDFSTSMIPDDTDAVPLKEVKEKAKKEIPRSGFSVTAKFAIIQGAFGTGKSHQIKKVVTDEDVVLAPFKRLLADYQEDASGSKIFFKTMHRAISDHRKARYMYIDECYSFPAEYLKVCMYLYQPEIVFLVGDTKQTKTLAAEGTCIDQVVDCKNAHYLYKNFRNPVSVVDWAVKKFGYDMVPAGPEFNSNVPMVEFKNEDWAIPDGVDHISPDRGLVNLDITSHTVRQFQGATRDTLAQTLTPESLNTFAVPCIKLVAMTRCRGTTYLRLCEGLTQDVVQAILDKKECPTYVPRPKKREPDDQKYGRFMNAIISFVSRRQQEVLMRTFNNDIKQAIVDNYVAEQAILDSQLPSKQVETIEELRESAMEDAECEVEEVRAFCETYDPRSPASTVYEPSISLDDYRKKLDEFVISSEDLETQNLINELNKDALAIEKDFWFNASVEERFFEVDRELALGRTLNPEAIRFLATNPRLRPTFVVPGYSYGSEKEVKDDDIDKFDPDDEDEDCSVLSFMTAAQ
jgi:hypothetical protein